MWKVLIAPVIDLATDLTTQPTALGRRTYGFIRRHRVLLALCLLVVIAVSVVDVRLFVVPKSDPPARTDAVVVLGGATFITRLGEGIRLVHEYPGTTLVVSTPGGNRCPRFVGPDTPVICFQPDPSTTQGEARAAADLARSHGWTSMTVVTTTDQIWRAGLRFSRCYKGDLRLVQAPTSWWGKLAYVPYEMGATVKAEVFQRSC